MDVRRSMFVAVALTGGVFAVPALGGSIGIQPTAPQSLFSGEFLVENEADHLVAFVFSQDETTGVSQSNSLNLSTDASSLHQSFAWIAGGGMSLNGSEEVSVDAFNFEGLESTLVSGEDALGGWSVRFMPAPTVNVDAGLQEPLTIPLPAPLAMGGFGLLGVAGIVSLRRRR